MVLQANNANQAAKYRVAPKKILIWAALIKVFEMAVGSPKNEEGEAKFMIDANHLAQAHLVVELTTTVRDCWHR